jgi:hypothetical protein
VLAVDAGVTPPTLTAVFTRPHAADAAISLANTPGAPPVFLKAVGVATPDPVTVTVSLAVDPSRSDGTKLAGDYDGIPWDIRPGTRLILDVGPDQEVVTALPGTFVLNPATGIGSFQVVVTRPHTDGLLITNTLLGNPGPQPRFDPRALASSGVVRYLSIIE